MIERMQRHSVGIMHIGTDMLQLQPSQLQPSTHCAMHINRICVAAYVGDVHTFATYGPEEAIQSD